MQVGEPTMVERSVAMSAWTMDGSSLASTRLSVASESGAAHDARSSVRMADPFQARGMIAVFACVTPSETWKNDNTINSVFIIEISKVSETAI